LRTSSRHDGDVAEHCWRQAGIVVVGFLRDPLTVVLGLIQKRPEVSMLRDALQFIVEDALIATR
jgi:hypothetical protein